MKTVFESSDSNLILYVESILKNAGITCIVSTGSLGGVHGGLSFVNSSTISVPSIDYEESIQLINEFIEV